MLNSEKMVASIQSQDLEHANKYFKRALKEDDAETLLELAEYLESIGFLPQAKEIYLQEREDYPEVNINLAQIATEDGDIEGAFLYLDAISPESDAYLSALLVMADIYEMEGLADVAREKLLQANQISDGPLKNFSKRVRLVMNLWLFLVWLKSKWNLVITIKLSKNTLN